MKNTLIKNKGFIIALFAMIFSIAAVNAQPGQQKQDRQGPPPIPSEKQIQIMVDDLSTELSLTDEQENQVSKHMACPWWSKMILLKLRSEMWEAQKHPFFKDRVVYNSHLFKMLSDAKIEKSDVAKVLETSTNYVDWIISKVNVKGEINETTEKVGET